MKQIKIAELEGRLADVDELRAAENSLLEGIASIIRASDMEDSRKEDVFTSIRDHFRKWEGEFGDECRRKPTGTDLPTVTG